MDVLNIELTQGDIDKGIRNVFLECPFTHAFKRVIPDATQVEVLPLSVIVRLPRGKARYFETPAKARNWMRFFDCGLIIGPGKFAFQEYAI